MYMYIYGEKYCEEDLNLAENAYTLLEFNSSRALESGEMFSFTKRTYTRGEDQFLSLRLSLVAYPACAKERFYI